MPIPRHTRRHAPAGLDHRRLARDAALPVVAAVVAVVRAARQQLAARAAARGRLVQARQALMAHLAARAGAALGERAAATGAGVADALARVVSARQRSVAHAGALKGAITAGKPPRLGAAAAGVLAHALAGRAGPRVALLGAAMSSDRGRRRRQEQRTHGAGRGGGGARAALGKGVDVGCVHASFQRLLHHAPRLHAIVRLIQAARGAGRSHKRGTAHAVPSGPCACSQE